MRIAQRALASTEQRISAVTAAPEPAQAAADAPPAPLAEASPGK
jgi:hypothetical protein